MIFRRNMPGKMANDFSFNLYASTPMGKILEHVQDGSSIYSDCLKGYKTEELEEADFSHFTVNHK